MRYIRIDNTYIYIYTLTCTYIYIYIYTHYTLYTVYIYIYMYPYNIYIYIYVYVYMQTMLVLGPFSFCCRFPGKPAGLTWKPGKFHQSEHRGSHFFGGQVFSLGQPPEKNPTGGREVPLRSASGKKKLGLARCSDVLVRLQIDFRRHMPWIMSIKRLEV